MQSKVESSKLQPAAVPPSPLHKQAEVVAQLCLVITLNLPAATRQSITTKTMTKYKNQNNVKI